MSLMTDGVALVRRVARAIWRAPTVVVNTIVHSIGPLDRACARLEDWAVENEVHGYEKIVGERNQ